VDFSHYLSSLMFIALLCTSLACAQTHSPSRPSASDFSLPLAPNQNDVPAKKSAAPIIYRNTQYGFCFMLPASWKGYSIITHEWSSESSGFGEAPSGPLLLIRHPKWTKNDPYEDIPIMIFTHAQWRRVDDGDVSVSAAPFGPGELGRNSKYVFAIPPRYYLDDLTGWEKVVKIVNHQSLRAPCEGHKVIHEPSLRK